MVDYGFRLFRVQLFRFDMQVGVCRRGSLIACFCRMWFVASAPGIAQCSQDLRFALAKKAVHSWERVLRMGLVQFTRLRLQGCTKKTLNLILRTTTVLNLVSNFLEVTLMAQHKSGFKPRTP